MTTPKISQSTTVAIENDAAVNAQNGAPFGGRRRAATRKVRKVKAASTEGRKTFRSKIPSKAAKHEAGTAFLSDDGFHDAIMAADELYTEETASDVISSINSTASSEFGHYEVIEYDLNDPESQDMSFNFGTFLTLSPTSGKADKKLNDDANGGPSIPFPDLDLVIEDNSPAAEALRANANIKVTTAGKAARAVHLQSIRRLAKFAAGANKTGYVKGKPPRLPPPTHRQMEGPFGGPSTLHSLREDGTVDDDDGEGMLNSEEYDINEYEIRQDQSALNKVPEDDGSGPDDNYAVDINQGKIAQDEIPRAVLEDVAEKNASSDDDNQHQVELLPKKVDQHQHQRLDFASNYEVAGAVTTSHHGVAPGTIEAGKKGMYQVNRLLPFIFDYYLQSHGIICSCLLC